MAYFPTSNGLFVAMNYKSCETKWSINVTSIVLDYAPLSPDQRIVLSPISRTSPQIAGDVLYFGTYANALIVAVDRGSGKTLGIVQVNAHPLAIITMSPTLFNVKTGKGNSMKQMLFVGASSAEEFASAVVPGYQCCSFVGLNTNTGVQNANLLQVGNMVGLAFDKASGFTKLWDVPMIPPEISGHGKWTGVAVWGPQPSIDLRSLDTVFIATGNVYTVPKEFENCQDNTTSTSKDCLPSNVWQEAVIALDANTGIPRWVHQFSPLDAWVLACRTGTNLATNCP